MNMNVEHFYVIFIALELNMLRINILIQLDRVGIACKINYHESNFRSYNIIQVTRF